MFCVCAVCWLVLAGKSYSFGAGLAGLRRVVWRVLWCGGLRSEGKGLETIIVIFVSNVPLVECLGGRQVGWQG